MDTMDPTLKAFLTTWEIRLDIVAIQLLFGIPYLLGWVRLYRQGAKIATKWRLTSYLSAQALFSIALMSGVDAFQYFLFFMHMIQHFLLIMFVPILIFWSAPLPIALWGLPKSVRLAIGSLLGKQGWGRRALAELSTPGLIWLIFTCTLWLWHDPNAYNTATEDQFIHDIEHISFFATGMLLWWQITGAPPLFQKKRSYMTRMVMIGMSYFQNIILGIGITMYGKMIYTHYAEVPRLWNIDPLTDQTMGGMIMWLPGGMMYLIAILVLIGRMIQASERDALKQQHKRRQKTETTPILSETTPS